MVKVQENRLLSAYDSKRLQRYALVDLLVKSNPRFIGETCNSFRGVRRSTQRVYALKSPHGNKKRGERLERVVYSMKAVGIPVHRGAGGVVERPSRRRVRGSLAGAYAAWFF